jgi:hypothetical protein
VSASTSVEPAQLGMPVPLSRPSRVCALLAHIAALARYRAATAAPGTRAWPAPTAQHQRRACVVQVSSRWAARRRAVIAARATPAQPGRRPRHPLPIGVQRAGSRSLERRRAATAARGMSVPLLAL